MAAFDPGTLRGRVAIVTGAGNNGIGWGLCRHAAGAPGMHLVDALEARDASPAADIGFALTPEAHARQVFDHIAPGHFHVLMENERPYVDHDRPFRAERLSRERHENMLARRLDDTDAWRQGGRRQSAILKGPMFSAADRAR